MTRLFLIRHGDAYDEEGLQVDDSPLNNFGKIQALQLAKRLKHNRFDMMYCSRIRRSMETCEIVNEHHKMKVNYTARLNEVGTDTWPQPGIKSVQSDLKDYSEATKKIYKTFREIAESNLNNEVIVFTHGNWIRVLLTKILANGDPKTFIHFVVHHTSLNIIDVDDFGFEHIITFSDAAHTQLYETRI
ncbi:hypothetical protein A2982_01985 [candidate division WWE3 bacterium RIFCSPLOWO2_01_FULL_39_13]|uniref:Phosphoglycerate mutase n=1 Tax=candidate division WWE3 bacterium RIFCSPLOWO2_01_FULL_39_13 TaxID=1802624 RepID=A0A1F4V3A3_UNCKA|nr:MAG: hypothetical protein A2982_01985 [candidate division WWE3 bacterium RIFCSPLOWO2_01_FULL_39_13]